ncbi:MAG: transglycosylase SLT domain-containing protein [Deltaproteobacteria bacterium]|nr:transglycosylase SLT domain-containing protein [Deltaproteobacteria bacterium]
MSRTAGSPCVRIILFSLSIIFSIAFFPQQARSDDAYGILLEGVLDYYKKMRESGAPRASDLGEDGVLLMRPEVAQSFGFQVYVDENYRTFREKLAEAEEFLEQAIDAMTTTVREKKKDEHVANVAHFACLYQRSIHSADKDLKKYRAALQGEQDDRFDKARCARLLEKLFSEGLAHNGGNLRDALGYVYNRSRGIEPLDGFPLTPENIRFVNYVFNYFLENAKPLDVQRFDLDRVFSSPHSRKLELLKKTLGGAERRYLPFLESVLHRHAREKYAVEPLLFLALMRQESRFDPLSISQVGAAGITQIMPGTGLLLGMTSIFQPPYFKKAREVMLKERTMKARALRFVREPEEYCREVDARKARRMMQEALLWKKKREGLYRRYKRELLSHRQDDRLDPKKAIEAGYRLFSELMREQKGDISLALAAYNAGSRAVRKYNGLPPYAETVTFRNRVLRYYRQYLGRMGWMSAKGSPNG